MPGFGFAEQDGGRRGVFSWNASGLSAELYAEFFRYLDLQATVDVAVIQETHWSTSGEWRQDSGSAYIAPLDGNIRTGLVVIRSCLLGNSEVCWQEVTPGRLLRVRAILDGQHWEIFGLYQRALTGGGHAGDGGVLDRRQKVWQALDRSVCGPSSGPYCCSRRLQHELKPGATCCWSEARYVQQGAGQGHGDSV